MALHQECRHATWRPSPIARHEPEPAASQDAPRYSHRLKPD
ncbi:hypothetical protein PAMC26510_20170 [Caballeronia sordidicola]|uniref:Uncharacterized protein n=1 Tax=Caballeronia sordidicola TaxID=196367 RepID=A0A242MP58_CABSO|nr:hypothetical protein PAMC26510_20170 [Caballeronia sordidicola]